MLSFACATEKNFILYETRRSAKNPYSRRLGLVGDDLMKILKRSEDESVGANRNEQPMVWKAEVHIVGYKFVKICREAPPRSELQPFARSFIDTSVTMFYKNRCIKLHFKP